MNREEAEMNYTLDDYGVVAVVMHWREKARCKKKKKKVSREANVKDNMTGKERDLAFSSKKREFLMFTGSSLGNMGAAFHIAWPRLNARIRKAEQH